MARSMRGEKGELKSLGQNILTTQTGFTTVITRRALKSRVTFVFSHRIVTKLMLLVSRTILLMFIRWAMHSYIIQYCFSIIDSFVH